MKINFKYDFGNSKNCYVKFAIKSLELKLYSFSIFYLFNKKYKPLLDTNQFNTDSKKYILSSLIASSLSEIILLSLNINNIKKR